MTDEQIPEPLRSQMERKDDLRKFQQALLKKTDVSFYKSQMQRHFRKILEATEVTYNDHNARRMVASWNLAKPAGLKRLLPASLKRFS